VALSPNPFTTSAQEACWEAVSIFIDLDVAPQARLAVPGSVYYINLLSYWHRGFS
jgi:hypothetical protein